ncbi:MAG: pectin acetylesterase-family hydrolase [Myxococcota bacterium]|nr:pectin acetylesterase-family hydrolase [Myxococcota bacterium]
MNSLLLMASMAQAAPTIYTVDSSLPAWSTLPDFTCNDGSDPAYWIEPARTTSDDWVIYFEGGGTCTDAASCAARKPQRMGTGCTGGSCGASVGVYSVSPAPPTPATPSGGFFSPNDPLYPTTANPFEDWNRVYVEYCSSDTYVGGGGSVTVSGFPHMTSPGTVNFNGNALTKAVIADLQDRHGMDTATNVLVAGGSAGSAGVQRNLDRIADLIKGSDPSIRVVGLFDASFGDLVDSNSVTAFNTGTGTCESEMEAGATPYIPGGYATKFSTWNAVLDDSCMTGEAVDSDCFSTAVMASGEYWDTPFYVSIGLYDQKYFESHVEPANPTVIGGWSAAEKQDCTADTLRSTFNEMSSSTSPYYEPEFKGVFAPCTTDHVLSKRNAWYYADVAGARPAAGTSATTTKLSDLLWDTTQGYPQSAVCP